MFYNGNEGDVTLYANNTGLMWENAAEFNALLVFAEHRYYGQSFPLGPTSTDMSYLSSTQALADYAVLIRSIKHEMQARELPVITFGGSYGGVLAAFFRAKYPGTVDGAIAASAPLRAFPGQFPDWDTNMYYQRITNDASSGGGASDNCMANVRSMWPGFFSDGSSAAGRATLSTAFQTCAPLETEDDVLALAFWIRGNWDTMSMGNYPYPSSYLTGGTVMLPAWPVREACAFLSTPITNNNTQLYYAVANAVAVIGNATPVPCNDITPNPYTHPSQQYDGIWDFQRCTELQPDSFWFATDGVRDMFWDQPYDLNFTSIHCAAAWNITTSPDYDWMSTAYEIPSFRGASNIVFSNGEYDPWGGAGILQSPDESRSLVSLNVSQGAHHLDLMFSNPQDPPAVTAVRQVEVGYIRQWVAEARARYASKRGEL